MIITASLFSPKLSSRSVVKVIFLFIIDFVGISVKFVSRFAVLTLYEYLTLLVFSFPSSMVITIVTALLAQFVPSAKFMPVISPVSVLMVPAFPPL